jgi:hypothetical protein
MLVRSSGESGSKDERSSVSSKRPHAPMVNHGESYEFDGVPTSCPVGSCQAAKSSPSGPKPPPPSMRAASGPRRSAS